MLINKKEDANTREMTEICGAVFELALSLVTEKERDQITKRLKKYAPKRNSLSFKGTWWKKEPAQKLVAAEVNKKCDSALWTAVLGPLLGDISAWEQFLIPAEEQESKYHDKDFETAFIEMVFDCWEDADAYARMIMTFICHGCLEYLFYIHTMQRFRGIMADESLSKEERRQKMVDEFRLSSVALHPEDREETEAVAEQLSEVLTGPAPASESVQQGADQTAETAVPVASEAQPETKAEEQPAAPVQASPAGETAEVSAVAAETVPAEAEAVPAAPVPPAPKLSHPGIGLTRVFEREEPRDVPVRRRGYSRYLGYVRTNAGNFHNFYPVAEWETDRFVPMEAGLAIQRFPTWGAFNLKYSFSKPPRVGAFFVADVDFDDFSENRDEKGRPRTDYARCIDYERVSADKRFYRASEFGIYPVVRPVEDEPDFTRNIPVTFTGTDDDQYLSLANEPVLLEVGDICYGPVRLKENSAKVPYVSFVGLSKDGLQKGYRSSKTAVRPLSQYTGSGDTLTLRLADARFMVPVWADTWSDTDLLRRLIKSLGGRRGEDLINALAESGNLLSEHPAVAAARFERAQHVVRTARLDASMYAAFADFVYEQVLSGNREATQALIAKTADDPALSECFVENSRIGRRLEHARERISALDAQAQLRKTRLDELRQTVEAQEKQCAETDKALAARAELLQFLDKSEAPVRQLQRLEEKSAAAKAETARLEKLNREILACVNAAQEKALAYGDDVLPGALSQAVAGWNEADETKLYARAAENLDGLREHADEDDQALLARLLAAVKTQRSYDDNMVINLFLCLEQNFLTVFAGEPGSGKTSICGILAKVLGLDGFDGNPALREGLPETFTMNRFVTVPVEYGWTTKRDFIGYRNPLTNRFESQDPSRWALLRRLDAEARRPEGSRWPALMLLDEANLSPMEYYWSDWMRLCDAPRGTASVNLWEKGPLTVPETLRFVATINNDSTTEPLSARLIDRAMVITLPEVSSWMNNPPPIGPMPPVTQDALTRLFRARGYGRESGQIHAVWQKVEAKAADAGIRLSPRASHQVQGYIGAASAVMTSTAQKAAWLDAVDFAVLQKVLPRVNGSGEAYRRQLEALQGVLNAEHLNRSAACLKVILKRGAEALDCYRFF